VCPLAAPAAFCRDDEWYERRDDLARRHSLGIQEKDFVIHGGKPALVLFDQLRLEATNAIAWGI